MQTIRKEKLEMLRKRYPAGTKVCLDAMEGEHQMESGLKGTVVYVDDIGQILVQWEWVSGRYAGYGVRDG